MLRKENPIPDAEAAAKDFERALTLNPKDTDTLARQGRMYADLAYYKYHNQMDPTEECRRMEESYDRALQIKNDLDEIWLGRGFGRTMTGLHLQSRGEDPTEIWDQAERDLDTAISLARDHAWTWLCRGELRFNRAFRKENLGEIAGGEYARALADYEQALKLNPGYRSAMERRISTAREKARPEY
jgi:tetratricopeptide (TPR) repeat protein